MSLKTICLPCIFTAPGTFSSVRKIVEVGTAGKSLFNGVIIDFKKCDGYFICVVSTATLRYSKKANKNKEKNAI